MSEPFPFTVIVAQDDMKLALILAAIDPSIGGVLAFGDRGAGKSTAVRALAALLPEIVVVGCPYCCDPQAMAGLCDACRAGGEPPTQTSAPRVVDLPLGATEDRVVGALDLERALASGERRFEPGLLARADRGFLYIDEVNLLEDHLVDLLLNVAASGVNVVEREGLSVRHSAKLVLIGGGIGDAALKRLALMILSHRLRRNPLDEARGSRGRSRTCSREPLGARRSRSILCWASGCTPATARRATCLWKSCARFSRRRRRGARRRWALATSDCWAASTSPRPSPLDARSCKRACWRRSTAGGWFCRWRRAFRARRRRASAR